MRADFASAGTRAGGERFIIHHEPIATIRGAIVCVHPFAEEMNKSRRMLALGSRALAGAGYAVLQLDLFGCGDSAGEWSNATWQDWIDDVVFGCEWLTQRHEAPLWIWGLRAGCLLAAEAAQILPNRPNLLFWQPQPSGDQVLRQFLRLRLAARLQQGGDKESLEQVRDRLDKGEAVHVAGYDIGSGIATGLSQSRLQPSPATEISARLVLLDVQSREPAQLTPSSQSVIDRWTAAGHNVSAVSVNGPPFWGTVEVEEAPALIRATVSALRDDH